MSQQLCSAIVASVSSEGAGALIQRAVPSHIAGLLESAMTPQSLPKQLCVNTGPVCKQHDQDCCRNAHRLPDGRIQQIE